MDDVVTAATPADDHDGIGRGYIEEAYQRDMRYLDDRITVDGAGGWPVEPGRYRLVVSRACPWANRAIIVRRLLGLEQVLPMGVTGPTHDWRSWTFDLDPGGVDPVLGIPRLKDAFDARIPGYERGITVPAIVDVPSGGVVTNDFKQITLDLSTEWRVHHRAGAPDLLPDDHRDELESVMEGVFRDVNNGVYEAGFAGTPAAYEQAYTRLFSRLDQLSDRLATRRFLVGDTITEADVRLFTTLVRFDAVYHNHFKCNRSKLTEMPVLWAYARDLFQTPGFGDPTGIVPLGPDLTGWAGPSAMARRPAHPLRGRPWRRPATRHWRYSADSARSGPLRCAQGTRVVGHPR